MGRLDGHIKAGKVDLHAWNKGIILELVIVN